MPDRWRTSGVGGGSGRGPPPLRRAARGLEVLHRHHLVHRDVTPGNLLLTSRPDGSRAVVVADLGVARSVLDSSAGAMIVGTPSYMAPEQAGTGAVDPRADVYALCAVAYALLTGGPPFAVLTIADLTSCPPDVGPAPLAARLEAPATLDGLFLSGLAGDPHRRPPSAAVLADAFDQIALELLDGVGPPPPRTSGAQLGMHTARLRRLIPLRAQRRPQPLRRHVPDGPRRSTSR